ncbi:MAG: exodeoxyribonuclease VII large subunit, partial [Acidimicrobiia bacterium]
MSAVLLDLTSADVLGIGHRLSDLTSDVPFTTGVPAVLGEQPAAPRLARAFARRQRAEAGLVARSTLHALWDLLCASATPSHHVLLDAGAYPIAHWATAAARQNGAGVDQVTHYDAAAFSRAAAAAARTRNRIILVLDGSCPGCGQVAPLEDIGWVAERYGALVIVDDTLACGVLGTAPSMLDPLGVDGVGSSAFTNVISERHVTVAELNRHAKQLLEQHFPLLWVAGEISNFTRAASGHWYFTLKDD